MLVLIPAVEETCRRISSSSAQASKRMLRLGLLGLRPVEVLVWRRVMHAVCRSTSLNPLTYLQPPSTSLTGSLSSRYLFTLFCGLVPLPLADLWTGDTTAVAREKMAAKKEDTPDRQLPTPASPLTHAEPFVAPGGTAVEKLPAAGALVSQVPVPPEESSRRVRFGPVSELVFQDYVEARAA